MNKSIKSLSALTVACFLLFSGISGQLKSAALFQEDPQKKKDTKDATAPQRLNGSDNPKSVPRPLVVPKPALKVVPAKASETPSATPH